MSGSFKEHGMTSLGHYSVPFGVVAVHNPNVVTYPPVSRRWLCSEREFYWRVLISAKLGNWIGCMVYTVIREA